MGKLAIFVETKQLLDSMSLLHKRFIVSSCVMWKDLEELPHGNVHNMAENPNAEMDSADRQADQSHRYEPTPQLFRKPFVEQNPGKK